MKKLTHYLFSICIGICFSVDCASQVFVSPCVGTFSRKGLFFDLEAKNSNVTISRFSLLVQNTGTRDLSIYYKAGTHVGFEANPAAWTLADTTQNWNPIFALACPIPPAIIPGDLNICIPANQRYGFYIIMTAGVGSIESHNTLTTGSLAVSNPDLNLYTGVGQNTLSIFNGGGPFTPDLTWQGEMNYTIQPYTIGNDTLICYGQSLILDAGNGFNGYLWNTGDTTQTIIVDSTATYYVNVSNGAGCDFVDSINVTVDSCLYINGYSAASQLFFASVINSQLIIKWNDNIHLLQMCNMEGKLIEVIKVNASEKEIILDINDLPHATYFIKGIATNKIYHTRFVKQY